MCINLPSVKVLVCLLFALGSFGTAHAQTVNIARHVWNSLSANEQTLIQENRQIQIQESDSYGFIIDNQGVNESTPGTSGGAALGVAVGNAVYVDKAINSGNYSAKTQLAAMLIGGMIGSSLDSKPNQQFHFRYALRLGNGEIKYFDQVQKDPFRHPSGICVSVSNFAPTEQQLCSQTLESVRSQYLTRPSTITGAQVSNLVAPSVSNAPVKTQDRVNCKLATQAPVQTTREKCSLINGSVEE